MVKKKLVISFPPRLIQEPVTYHLIRDYDLQVNILRATVRPRERGRMVVEIKGEKKNLDRAFEYMESVGLQVDPLVQEMRYYPERCVHCTACTAVCPTEALTVDPASRELVFDASHCIICESCIPACSYAAIESQF
ncbi:MAG: 4Fe-4S dicluster domain-containing protein [Desulfarculus sp.]|nr:4Fe-4S dicluster domain-containing protein [Desulfarculus sp.]